MEGDEKDCFGVDIKYCQDGATQFAQPHLIDKILKALCIDKKTTIKDTPASSLKILACGMKSKPFDKRFHYHSVIGLFNNLDAGIHSDILYVTHQCTQFAADP